MRQCRDHVRAVQESLPSPTPAAAAAAAAAPAAPEQASGGAGLGKRRRSAATPAEERASSGRKGRRKHMSFELGELLEAEGKRPHGCVASALLCPQQRLTSVAAGCSASTRAREIEGTFTEEEGEHSMDGGRAGGAADARGAGRAGQLGRQGPRDVHGASVCCVSPIRTLAEQKLLAVAAPHWEFGGGSVLQVRGTQAAAEEGRPPGPAAQVRV